MMPKHKGHETCSKISRMSVRLVVRSRCSVNYDETGTIAKNDPNYATNFLSNNRIRSLLICGLLFQIVIGLGFGVGASFLFAN
ncbi:hypothetical protein Hanom_Chr10g00910001 [Helianthus anomalus]